MFGRHRTGTFKARNFIVLGEPINVLREPIKCQLTTLYVPLLDFIDIYFPGTGILFPAYTISEPQIGWPTS
jgi:hypothetical protein